MPGTSQLLASASLLAALGIDVFCRWRTRRVRPFLVGCPSAVPGSVRVAPEIAAHVFAANRGANAHQTVQQVPPAAAIGCFGSEYAQFAYPLTRHQLTLPAITPLLARLLALASDAGNPIWLERSRTANGAGTRVRLTMRAIDEGKQVRDTWREGRRY